MPASERGTLIVCGPRWTSTEATFVEVTTVPFTSSPLCRTGSLMRMARIRGGASGGRTSGVGNGMGVTIGAGVVIGAAVAVGFGDGVGEDVMIGTGVGGGIGVTSGTGVEIGLGGTWAAPISVTASAAGNTVAITLSIGRPLTNGERNDAARRITLRVAGDHDHVVRAVQHRRERRNFVGERKPPDADLRQRH